MYPRILILIIALAVFGCGKKGCEIPDEAQKIAVDVDIERLEKPFFELKSKADAAAFVEKNQLFAQRFLRAGQLPDSVLLNSLTGLATNPELKKLAAEAEKRFGDMAKEEEQLETAFKILKSYYPDFQVPEVKTFVSGLGQDLLVSDSLFVFSIDFFIGKDASYRPDTYAYILERYERDNMVPAAMLLLSNRFNKTNNQDRNLLAEMINTGKAYYFVKEVMPCTPDSTIIGYSAQKLADVHHNEGKIWAHFIEKSLLYDKNPFTINKYIGERPNTPEIDANAPGRLGSWVGLQIVRKYMERNPKVTLPELMADDDYQKIFSESKYKPEKKR